MARLDFFPIVDALGADFIYEGDNILKGSLIVEFPAECDISFNVLFSFKDKVRKIVSVFVSPGEDLLLFLVCGSKGHPVYLFLIDKTKVDCDSKLWLDLCARDTSSAKFVDVYKIVSKGIVKTWKQEEQGAEWSSIPEVDKGLL